MQMRYIVRTAILATALLLSVAGCRRAPSSRIYPDPERYPVRGIDISAHNGKIDFDRVRESGIQFVIIKATEGATFKDKRFLDNLRGAQKAGLKVGVYHFFRFDTPGYMQSLNLLHSLRGRHIDLPVTIDIEEWTNPTSSTTTVVLGRLNEMIHHLEANGMRVMLYTNKNGHARFILRRYEGYPLWICSLVEEPTVSDWTIWQATHNGRVDGIDHAVDVNAFIGTVEDWEKFTSDSTRQTAQ